MDKGGQEMKFLMIGAAAVMMVAAGTLPVVEGDAKCVYDNIAPADRVAIGRAFLRKGGQTDAERRSNIELITAAQVICDAEGGWDKTRSISATAFTISRATVEVARTDLAPKNIDVKEILSWFDAQSPDFRLTVMTEKMDEKASDAALDSLFAHLEKKGTTFNQIGTHAEEIATVLTALNTMERLLAGQSL
jgi:hypothetical protein